MVCRRRDQSLWTCSCRSWKACTPLLPASYTPSRSLNVAAHTLPMSACVCRSRMVKCIPHVLCCFCWSVYAPVLFSKILFLFLCEKKTFVSVSVPFPTACLLVCLLVCLSACLPVCRCQSTSSMSCMTTSRVQGLGCLQHWQSG